MGWWYEPRRRKNIRELFGTCRDITVNADPMASDTGDFDVPGNRIKTVPTAAAPSAVLSTAIGRISGNVDNFDRPRLRICVGVFEPGPNKMVIDANGRFAICNISTTWRLRARRISAACLVFHATTQTAKNRKKHEKNTEKNTNRSMCSWSWRKNTKP